MKQKSVYPSWRYHKTHGEKLVMNEQEDQSLAHEWVHSPAHFDKDDAPNEGLDSFEKDVIDAPKRRGRPRKDA